MTKKKKDRRTPERQTGLSVQRLARLYWPAAIFFLALIAFFCFYHLGQLPARDWDEARHGVSAYEMLKNGNFIINTYQYQPDYFNLKPPLSFWGVMLGYKLFGFGLTGMRFYSAAAFVLMSAGILLFAKWRYGRLESLLIVALLSCCAPFYRFHFGRHGDADALFAAFSVAALLAAMIADQKPRALYVCAFAFACAFLTKSWHALYIPAAAAVILLARGAFPRQPRQWAGMFAAGAGPVLLWAAARYAADGVEFFRQMFLVDLFNRTTQVLENHSGGPFYYLFLLPRSSFVVGALPLLAGLLYYMVTVGDRIPAAERAVAAARRDLTAYLIWFFVPLFLFSLAKTKLSWYLIPLLIPVVMLTGLLLGGVLRTRKPKLMRYCGAALCCAAFVAGSVQTAREIRPPFHDPAQEFLHSRRDALPEAAHGTAYLDIDQAGTPDFGMQKYILLGELYFDWDCKTGTLEDFLADPQAQFLLTENSPPPDETGIEILAEDGRYFICRKV